jgi:3'-phosphoadenosine 5'-phosphosulfate sulfotransferase (PAPS reductase)/FAD synthetase
LRGAGVTPLQRAAWIARAVTAAHVRRIDAAIARIADTGQGYAVSESWGKDSVVLLDLAVRALGRVVAVHGRYSQNEELPDIPVVRDAVLTRLGSAVDYVEVPVWGDWEIYGRAGRFFLAPETESERALVRDWKREFVGALEGAALAHGATGMMLGMAGHESHGRRMNVAVRGDHYQAHGRLPTLLPLARWSADDVVAYHLGNDLPWLRIYDLASDPRQARSEFAFVAGAGDATRRHGGWAAWKEAYPSLFRTWQKIWGIE